MLESPGPATLRPTAGTLRVRTRPDSAASPVVGMVLVLAISVLGITGVLMWGLPAINEMKASVEHQAIATEFHELVGDVNELAKATASKTAKMWRYSQTQGDFTVQPATERWVVGLDGTSTRTTYDVTAFGLDDNDHKFALVNQRAIPSPSSPAAGLQVNLKADFTDGAATVPLYWADLGTSDGTCPANPPTPALTNAYLPWAAGGIGGKRYFCLYEATVGGYRAAVIGPRALQIQLTNSTLATETVSWIWAVDVGRAQWKLNSASGMREVFVSNGVVIQGSNEKLGLDGDPTISPPAKQGEVWRFFARLISLNGTASLGGQARLDVLLHLYGTRSLADEVLGNATKIWTYGRLESTWDSYLLQSQYAMVEKAETATGAPTGTKYLLYKPVNGSGVPTGVKLILHHSVITARG